MSFESLPNYVLVHVFSYLTVDDILLSVRPTCRRLKELSEHPYLWRSLKYERTLERTDVVSKFLRTLKVAAPHVQELVFNFDTASKKFDRQTGNLVYASEKDEVILHDGIVCPNLRSIKLHQSPSLDTTGRLVQKYPNLETFEFDCNFEVDIRGLLALFSNQLPRLKNLSLNWGMIDFITEHDGDDLQLYEEGNRLMQELIQNHKDLESFTAEVQMSSSTSDLLLAECPKLRVLEIDERLPTIARQVDVPVGSFLQDIRLKGNSVGNIHIQILCLNVKQIKNMTLFRCNNISDEALKHLFRCRMLKSLLLLKCQTLTNDVYIKHVSKCGGLEKIVIRTRPPRDEPPCPEDDDTVISDAGLQAIASGCSSLTEIYIAHSTQNISDTGIAALADGCPQLAELDAYHCDNLTDFSLLALGERSHQLQKLILGECPHFTSVGVNAILTRCRKLREVDLDHSVYLRYVDMSYFQSVPTVFDSYVTDLPVPSPRVIDAPMIQEWELQQDNQGRCVCHYPRRRPPKKRCHKVAVIGDPANFRQIMQTQQAQQVGAQNQPQDNQNQQLDNQNQQQDNQNIPQDVQNQQHDVQNLPHDIQNQQAQNPFHEASHQLHADQHGAQNQQQNVQNQQPNVQHDAQIQQQGLQNQQLQNHVDVEEISSARQLFLDCLSDHSIPRSRRHSMITNFYLTSCVSLDERSVEQLTFYCPELRHLIISGCVSLTNSALYSIARNSKVLQRLEMTFLPNISRGAVVDVINSLNFLETIVVSTSDDCALTSTCLREMNGTVSRTGRRVVTTGIKDCGESYVDIELVKSLDHIP